MTSPISSIDPDVNHSDTTDNQSSSPNQLTFDELPVEIVGEILGKLDLVNRLKTRKVCRKMRQANSQMWGKVENLGITIVRDQIELDFDDVTVKYRKTSDSQCTVSGNGRTVFLEAIHIQQAIEDLKVVMKIPKIRIEQLSMTARLRDDGSKDVMEMLQKASFDRKFHVEEAIIRVSQTERLLSILALLKPRTLKKIRFEIGYDDDDRTRDVGDLLRMEQFKNAKVVNLEAFAVLNADQIFENFANFDKFNIAVHSMSTEHVVRLREMIIRGSAHFEECSIVMEKGFEPSDIDRLRLVLAEPEENRQGHTRFIEHRCELQNGAFFVLKIGDRVISCVKHSKELVKDVEEETPQNIRPSRFFLRALDESSSSSDSD